MEVPTSSVRAVAVWHSLCSITINWDLCITRTEIPPRVTQSKRWPHPKLCTRWFWYGNTKQQSQPLRMNSYRYMLGLGDLYADGYSAFCNQWVNNLEWRSNTRNPNGQWGGSNTHSKRQLRCWIRVCSLWRGIICEWLRNHVHHDAITRLLPVARPIKISSVKSSYCQDIRNMLCSL